MGVRFNLHQNQQHRPRPRQRIRVIKFWTFVNNFRNLLKKALIENATLIFMGGRQTWTQSSIFVNTIFVFIMWDTCCSVLCIRPSKKVADQTSQPDVTDAVRETFRSSKRSQFLKVCIWSYCVYVQYCWRFISHGDHSNFDAWFIIHWVLPVHEGGHESTNGQTCHLSF